VQYNSLRAAYAFSLSKFCVCLWLMFQLLSARNADLTEKFGFCMCFSKPGHIAFVRCCRKAAKVKVATGNNAVDQITTVCPKKRMVKKSQWYGGLNLPYQTCFPHTVNNSPQY
jgi:hypothetical protein